MTENKKGLYILLFSVHGLIRSQDLEMGRDADTGGQVKYVLELARNLMKRQEVERVDLFTRMIRDKEISQDYSKEVEPICHGARIVRISCGGGKYIRKELLWPHLDEFIDKTLKFLKAETRTPSLFHGHYADGGYIAMTLATLFGVPFVFTGHSLGLSKQEKLLEEGTSLKEINRKYFMEDRIQVEENILSYADLVVTSTEQEVREQYGLYKNQSLPNYIINPPGLDLTRFFPYYDQEVKNGEEEIHKQARVAINEELNRFFIKPDKPLILALSRPDKRKNVSALIQAYGENKDLQKMANLAVFLGIRRNILDMEENERTVLIETLLLMDKYDLYGKIAIPKKHNFTYEVPELYRIAASRKGVFVNPALIEPFGLTLLEAAACGVPIVATRNGGPTDIVRNCRNGTTVDVTNNQNIATAIKNLLIDDDLWAEKSRNGINNVRIHYTWKAHIDRYVEYILKLGDEARSIKTLGMKEPVARRVIRLNKLLIVDIDNTLTGDKKALNRFLELFEKSRDRIGLGLATGRNIEMTSAILKELNILNPDILITSVGSEIYYAGEKLQDPGWRSHIKKKWERARVIELLQGLPFLQLQEDIFQRPFKVSFYMEPGLNHIVIVNEILTKARIFYTLVWSHEALLDILPQRASKGKAVRYISYKWEIPMENIMVCGDSGNDEEMLRGSTKGVVVANYSPELEVLKGKRGIYFSTEKYAAGVLDGLKHYRFLED